MEQLTELERTKLENYALRHSLLQQSVQQLLAERNAYIKSVEENHHGYKWDEAKGGLIAEPQPQPQPQPIIEDE